MEVASGVQISPFGGVVVVEQLDTSNAEERRIFTTSFVYERRGLERGGRFCEDTTSTVGKPR